MKGTDFQTCTNHTKLSNYPLPAMNYSAGFAGVAENGALRGSKMSSKNVRGVEPPTPDWRVGEYVRIRWAKVGYPVRFQCWSSKIHGQYLHWVGTSNMLCTGPGEDCCVYCLAKFAKHWYGWLAGRCRDKSHVIVAQIPFESFQASTPLQSADLLGAQITLERTERARARVIATVSRSRAFTPPAGWTEPDVGKMIERKYSSFKPGLDVGESAVSS